MMNVDLMKVPYCLDEAQIARIKSIIAGMRIEEKCGQLFCDVQRESDIEKTLEHVRNKHVGAVMASGGKLCDVTAHITQMQACAKVPLLIAANLEAGGNGILEEGTYYGKQMQIAATNDVNKAEMLGGICGEEGRIAGVNWAFAPVCDINYNFRNPMASVRTYGSDADCVGAMVSAYISALQGQNLAACAKHFPGDGVDERDQHYVMSVNSLSCEEWDRSYGQIYKKAIENGVLTVMAGHIAMPAYEEYFSGEVIYRPATQSENMITKLLKEKLGFNGLVTTDATQMIGFCSGLKRQEALVQAINSGCDMLLFSIDFDEDYQWVLEACKNGNIMPERLEDALMRILGVKMKLGLFDREDFTENTGANGGCLQSELLTEVFCCHQEQAAVCADEAVTLVKDTQKLLPLSSVKYAKVLLVVLGESSSNATVEAWFRKYLEKEGFDVYTYSLEALEKSRDTVAEFKKKYDLVLYVGNIDDCVNSTGARILWRHQMGYGNHIPWFVREVPTLCVSLGSPYLLLDIPMIPTYINGYSNSEFVVQAAVEKLVGKSVFKGKSPVDPFCGYEDTKL